MKTVSPIIIGSFLSMIRLFFTVLLLGVIAILSSCSPTSAAGSPVHGELIYREGKGEAPACINCHALEGDDFSLGPNMVGFKARVPNELLEGQTVEDYLRLSILDPNAYLVPGYRNIMYSLYGEHLTEEDVNNLIAYILSL